MISRRNMVIGGAAIMATSARSRRAASQAFAGQTIRFATYGGTWQQWVAAKVEPIFKARTGASIEYVVGIPLQHLGSLVAARGQQPPFDLVSLTFDLTITAVRQGLLMRLDQARIPNVARLPERLRPTADHGPGDYIGLEGILYDPAKFRSAGLAPPTDWNSLADPALAGRVAIPDITFNFKQVYAAINKVETGDETNLAGTIKWLSRLKSPLIYNDFPTLQTRFSSGEIWAMIGVSGYALRWPDRTIGFVRPPVGTQRGVLHLSTLEIPTGTARRELAEQLIDVWLSDEVQLSLAKTTGFTPSNSVAAAEAAKDPKLADLIAATPESVDTLYSPDWERINAVYSEWIDQWNRAIRR